MSEPDIPIAMEVIRAVEEETYEAAVHNQIAEVQTKTDVRTFDDLVATYESWEI